MTSSNSSIENDRQRLAEAEAKGTLAKLGAYTRLSGPGWMQSAITLGGGSLASSLYLGVVGGFTFLWVQPIAMLLGIVMLSGIAYVTLSTQQRPFRAINEHVSPVLGWSWALAALAANVFWSMPQYVLATGVLEQNLFPNVLGPEGSLLTAAAGAFGADSWMATNAGKLLIVTVILLVSTIVTWCYNTGSWGVRLYEVLVKLMVASIVLCFVGVTAALAGELDWAAIARGFIPDLDKLFFPSDAFQAVLEDTTHGIVWSETIVNEQRELMISAAATAVGINMTFLFPYSLLRKKWTREFRGLTTFDLSTGMLIPFVLATSCVIIAAADRFHVKPAPGFGFNDAGAVVDDDVKPNEKTISRYYELLTSVLPNEIGEAQFQKRVEADVLAAENDGKSPPPAPAGAAVRKACDQLSAADRKIAAMLVRRSAFDLATALGPLVGGRTANWIFGLGVLGMALSTIAMLLLISGFVVCELFDLSQDGWAFRFGCMISAIAVAGPFVWSRAEFYLAVWVSSFGMMLLPLAYFSFLFLMNRKALLGKDMPVGRSRLWWNLLMGFATAVATLASCYTLWKKAGAYGVGALGLLIVLAVIFRPHRAAENVRSRRDEVSRTET